MTLFGIINIVAGLINLATPVVVALALLYFFWGLATYILNASDDDGKKKGRDIMIWGILALFVMVSVWGIINVVRDTFQLDDSNIPIPGVQGGGTY
jgi:uncharacterized protein YhhL (DUF1145 family)